MQHSETSRGHAVNAPVRVAMVVADGNGEPSVVGPDEVDDRALAAADLQRLAFARVCCLVSWFWERERELLLDVWFKEIIMN